MRQKQPRLFTDEGVLRRLVVLLNKNRTETLIRLVASYSNSEYYYDTPSLSAILPVSSARFQAFVPPAVTTLYLYSLIFYSRNEKTLFSVNPV